MPADFIFFIGNFDPKAMNNFYDNIEPGPVVQHREYSQYIIITLNNVIYKNFKSLLYS